MKRSEILGYLMFVLLTRLSPSYLACKQQPAHHVPVVPAGFELLLTISPVRCSSVLFLGEQFVYEVLLRQRVVASDGPSSSPLLRPLPLRDAWNMAHFRIAISNFHSCRYEICGCIPLTSGESLEDAQCGLIFLHVPVCHLHMNEPLVTLELVGQWSFASCTIGRLDSRPVADGCSVELSLIYGWPRNKIIAPESGSNSCTEGKSP